MKVIQGNVVSALLNEEVDYMLHVTNCQGAMNSGVAKEVRERIPQAYEAFMAKHKEYENTYMEELGETSYALGVYNLHAQQYYGYDGKRYLNYGALAKGLSDIYNDLWHGGERAIKIGIPYNMGSDRAGGDWTIVQELIEGLQSTGVQVIAYKL